MTETQEHYAQNESNPTNESLEDGRNSSANSSNGTQLKTYAPVLRDGPYERSVMKKFGGMRRFMQDGTLDLMPIIEVTDESDLGHLSSYAAAGSPVLVDAPQYLTQTSEPNGETADVENLLGSIGGPIKFLNENTDHIDVPVVSGQLETPFDYSELVTRYERLSDDYDRVSLRPFVAPERLTTHQKEDLHTLAEEVGDDDIILLDYIQPHAGSLGPSATGRENLIEAATVFEDNPCLILDAFDVFEGENYNYGPAIAREAGVEGFGDFAVDRRFPPAEDIPMGMHDTRNIYHYDFKDREVKKFQGEGYNGSESAFEELSDWSKWDSHHCEFCEEAEASTSEGPGTWKRIRMGHYIESVLEEES